MDDREKLCRLAQARQLVNAVLTVLRLEGMADAIQPLLTAEVCLKQVQDVVRRGRVQPQTSVGRCHLIHEDLTPEQVLELDG